ncbi:hypothetical protein VP01_8008g1, partial [Puccinia sorghi]
NPQQDVSIQLAVATCRLGSNSNRAAVLRLKNLFQVGYRTIKLYTTQVIKTIYNMQSQLTSWPTQEERVELSQVLKEEGFTGCVVLMDGTMIPLSQKPPITMIAIRVLYSISLTLFCDFNKKFTSYLAGYSGSCHDSYVFSNMQIAQQPEKFFDQNQFLLADSAYTSDWFMLPAYKGKELLDHQNMKDTNKWIIIFVVIHNLLVDLKDKWNELYEEDEDSAPVAEDDIENSNNGICGILHPIYFPILKNLNDSCHISSNLPWPPSNQFFTAASLLSSAPKCS